MDGASLNTSHDVHPLRVNITIKGRRGALSDNEHFCWFLYKSKPWQTQHIRHPDSLHPRYIYTSRKTFRCMCGSEVCKAVPRLAHTCTTAFEDPEGQPRPSHCCAAAHNWPSLTTYLICIEIVDVWHGYGTLLNLRRNAQLGRREHKDAMATAAKSVVSRFQGFAPKVQETGACVEALVDAARKKADDLVTKTTQRVYHLRGRTVAINTHEVNICGCRIVFSTYQQTLCV